jgi:hypothetical protein
MLEVVPQYQAQKVLFDGRNVTGKPRDFERFLYGEFAAQETMRLLHKHGIAPRCAYGILEPFVTRQGMGKTLL